MTDSLEPDPPLSTQATGSPLAQRVSDAERDETVTLLREHLVVGRLTLDEFSERVSIALEARTSGDLNEAMANLPATATATATAAVTAAVEPTRRRARRWFVAVMSGSSAKGRWRISGRTTAVAVMGGCDMDLRHAEIDGPEIVITAVAFWGGIKIIVPEGFDVELSGFSFMGGRDLRLRKVPLIPGSPRIFIRGFAVMGGIDVRSRPSRSGREIGQTIVDQVLGAVSTMPRLPGPPGAPGAGAPGPGPIDLEALRRDITQQFRAQRNANRSRQRVGREHHGVADHEDPPERTSPTVVPRDEPATEVSTVGEATVTILFSDMVDYAGMTERLGDQASREVLRDHHEIVRGLIRTHGGREIKVQGDGFMVAFGGVARSLRCASDMQRAFAAYSDARRDRPIRVHIGVHTGEAMEEDDDFLGHTVIVASRIADQAGPGEILVSSLSAQMVERTEEFNFVDQREITLKGLTRPQRIATLMWDS
jgi:class 3 adenylate cyclase